jgi:TRAP-type C4-dicarboxylate transport system substrate-binding protein
VNRYFMISVISLLAILAILCGCAAPAPTPTPTPTPTPAPAPAPPAKVTELKWAMQQAPMSNQIVKWAIPLAEEMGKKSNGRLKVTVFPAEALGKGAEHWNMLTNRVCDITNLHPAAYGKNCPLCAFITVPLGLDIRMKNKEGKYIVDFIGEKYISPTLPFKSLAYYQYGMNEFIMGKKQIKTVEDCKGIILGYTSGRPYQLFLQKLGMKPEQIGLPDTYIAIDKGTIDGYWAGSSVIESFGLGPVVKNICTDVNVSTSLDFLAMNNDAWKSLSPEDQKVITDVGVLAREMWYDIQIDQNKVGRQIAVEKGNAVIYNLPPAERARFMSMASDVADEWAKELDGRGLPGTSLVKDLREQLAEVKK